MHNSWILSHVLLGMLIIIFILIFLLFIVMSYTCATWNVNDYIHVNLLTIIDSHKLYMSI